MHLHADHSLFFERRQPLWVAALAVALTSSVLIVNAGARSTVLSLTCSGLGAVLLLFAHAHGRRRTKPALAWTLGVVALALLAGVALNSDTDVIVQTSARVLCGAIWILWLGTQIDWASLRQLLLRIRIPEGIVASLDHALMHGVLAQREWVQRRDAGRLRLGVTAFACGRLGTAARRRRPACLYAPRTRRGERPAAQCLLGRRSGS